MQKLRLSISEFKLFRVQIYSKWYNIDIQDIKFEEKDQSNSKMIENILFCRHEKIEEIQLWIIWSKKFHSLPCI